MTRSKLGKSKRLVAVVCALLLALEVVAFPMTQAKAAATAALTAVGFGVTTAAFLAACGIYPYWTSADVSETFNWGDWETEDLAALLQEYNAANVASPIASQQIQAFLQGATLVVGSVVWEKLRAFAEWIKTKYAVTDNQMGVELGEQNIVGVSTFSTVPSAGDLLNSGWAFTGLYASGYAAYFGVYGATSPVYMFMSRTPVEGYYPTYISKSPFTLYAVKTYGGSLVSSTYQHSFSSSGATVSAYFNSFGYSYASSVSPVAGVPYFYTDVEKQSYNYFYGGSYSPDFQGITADTSTVSIPDALPEGAEYGGLRVSGLPAATTAESVTDAVQDSVGERLKTPVEVVEVELAPGTEVDSETGAITQNPVVIEAPVQETIPALSALAPSQEFVAAMMEALQTKFPFCLPFDFMRVLQAFVKPPDAPVITVEFHDRIGGGTYTITVDLEPWDDIAAVVRRLESMILFLGFWLNFDKFNVLNIILGQIG